MTHVMHSPAQQQSSKFASKVPLKRLRTRNGQYMKVTCLIHSPMVVLLQRPSNVAWQWTLGFTPLLAQEAPPLCPPGHQKRRNAGHSCSGRAACLTAAPLYQTQTRTGAGRSARSPPCSAGSACRGLAAAAPRQRHLQEHPILAKFVCQEYTHSGADQALSNSIGRGFAQRTARAGIGTAMATCQPDSRWFLAQNWNLLKSLPAS